MGKDQSSQDRNKDQNFWNSYSKKYSMVEKLVPHKEMMDAFISLVPSDCENILDVGCGLGTLLSRIHEDRPKLQLHGIDFSNEMLDTAKNRIPGLKVTQADLNQSLPFPDNSFDCVVSSNVIYAVEDPKALAKEILRVLQPGGTAILSSPQLGTNEIGIFLYHWKKVGLFKGFLDFLFFIPGLLFNAVIVFKAKTNTYHFLDKHWISEITSNFELHPNTFANQNWVLSIRK